MSNSMLSMRFYVRRNHSTAPTRRYYEGVKIFPSAERGKRQLVMCNIIPVNGFTISKTTANHCSNIQQQSSARLSSPGQESASFGSEDMSYDNDPEFVSTLFI